MKHLAALLPDIPRWVELRGMLLSRRCRVFEASEDPLALVVRSSVLPLAAVAGAPAPESILSVAEEPEPGLEVLAPPELRRRVDELLPGWKCRVGILHQLGSFSRLVTVSEDVRLLNPGDEPADVDAALAREIRCAVEFGAAAAAFVDGRPVAFCLTPFITEGWWDISIETAPGYRRRGLAAQCASFLIAEMRRRGRRPVWGSFPSNTASMALAARLGFEPADEILVYSTSV